MIEKPSVIQSAYETFGSVPEELISAQVDAFLAAQEEHRLFAERFKQTYADSQFLMEIEPDSINDHEVRDGLRAIQSLFRGPGGE